MSPLSRTPRTVLGVLVPGVLDPGAATRIPCVVRSQEASSLCDLAICQTLVARLLNYRYHPVHSAVRELIAAGEIGEIGSVRFEVAA